MISPSKDSNQSKYKLYLINQKSNSGLAESCSVVGSGVVVGGGVVVRQLRGDNSVSLWEMLSVKH